MTDLSFLGKLFSLMSHCMFWPIFADVPEAGSPGQNLLPLGVPPHHHPTVLLAQQTLQLRVDSILTGKKMSVRSIHNKNIEKPWKNKQFLNIWIWLKLHLLSQTCFFQREVMRRISTAFSLGVLVSMYRVCSTTGMQSWNIKTHGAYVCVR